MKTTFRLDDQVANLTSWNPRAELHGEEKKSASDIFIAYSTSNDVLSDFDSSLKSAFYRAPHPGEEDLIDQAGETPASELLRHLKFPFMANVIKPDAKIVGAEVTIQYGTGGKSDIVFAEATVDKFKLDLMDGGTVKVELRIVCHPDDKQLAKLYSLLGQEITITILPPGAGEPDPFRAGA